MYTVAVKDHVMIAHSLRGRQFGPAQRLHGATFVVTTEYAAPTLDRDGVVLDMGRAHELLREVLEPLRYQNLDELDAFRDTNTTTEVLARYIHETLAERLAGAFCGRLRVVLEESHVAWGAYEAPVEDGAAPGQTEDTP